MTGYHSHVYTMLYKAGSQLTGARETLLLALKKPPAMIPPLGPAVSRPVGARS